MSQKVKIGVVNWQNASKQDLLQFILRNTGIMVVDSLVEGSMLVGYVANTIQAQQLVNWSDAKFAGRTLRFTQLKEANGAGTSKTIELLRNVILQRYDAQNKMLNLSNLFNDPILLQNGLLNSIATKTRAFPALLKVASEEISIVIESINLADNKLKDITLLSTLPQYFPHLRNLCLANNQLNRTQLLDSWRNKFLNLQELLMINNSMVKYYNYRNEILKIFPKLVMLDNVMVRDSDKLNKIYRFPFKLQQFLFENNSIGSMATEFITNYLNIWDSNNRSQLINLYTPETQFSLVVDSNIPSSSVARADTNPSFGYYIANSRNRLRITHENTLQQRLAKGPQQIMDLFNKLPLSKHNLVEIPLDYKMESIVYSAVNGFLLILHGCFEETGKPLHTEDKNNANATSNNNGIVRTSQRSRRYASSYNPATSNSLSNTKLSRKSFDRIFTIVSMNGTLIIASELFTVRAYTPRSWCNDELNSTHKNIPTQMPTPLNTMNSVLPSTLNIPMDIQQKLTPFQVDIVKKINQTTKLNLQYSLMLAEQSNWSYEVCIQNFQSNFNNLPPDAFV